MLFLFLSFVELWWKPKLQGYLIIISSLVFLGYDCSHEFSLVAKVIPKGTGKGKKQKDQDRLCDTLYYEYTLYTGCMIEFPYLPARPEKFYGFDEVAGVRYLVMERLEADLYALCTRGPKLSTRDIAKWGIQILNGLKWIHNLGFVFVDVKPENFMIKEDKLFFIDCKNLN